MAAAARKKNLVLIILVSRRYKIVMTVSARPTFTGFGALAL
jgi:hypothetical protein